MDLASIDWHKWTGLVIDFVDFLGDFVTVVIGGITIYGVIKYRKKLTAILRVLRLDHLTARRKEIAETLDLLSGTIVKGKSPEARALFGRLDGQLIALCDAFPEFADLQRQVSSIAHDGSPLTEPIKQKLIHQITAQFEAFRLKNMNELAGEGK